MNKLFTRPSRWMDEDLVIFDEFVRRFLGAHMTAERLVGWREKGVVERAAWEEMGAGGMLGLSLEEKYGGSGGDFRHEAVLLRRLGLIGAEGWGISVHTAICSGYISKFGTEEQRRRWLPKIASGEFIAAIAMTEPGAGSDLQGIGTTARAAGNGYVINGQKTFITNGQLADLILVVAKTDPGARGKGISLLAVETADAPGFERGRNLDKVGLDMGDTSELFFNDVRVPADNVIGGEAGRGFHQLMEELPKERLIIAIESLAMIEAALEHTLDYVAERKAFRKRLLDFQNTQFVLAECKTEAVIARSFVDDCIVRFMEGELDAATASMAKYWVSERAQNIVDSCLQLFGGYGYTNEYPIGRMYRDVRVRRIYGGTTEIMKVLIARSLET